MTTPQEQFRVSLEAFDGPLDLLLFLVRRAEIDIHEIPIAQIADEYLAVLQADPAVDVELAGEFLVMAATLIEIKSRSLVPEEQLAEDDATEESVDMIVDPRGELIKQLLVFQRIRFASEMLEEQRIAFGQRYDVVLTVPDLVLEDPEPSIELDDVHILDLSDAYEHIASAIDFSRLGEHHVSSDEHTRHDKNKRGRRAKIESIAIERHDRDKTLLKIKLAEGRNRQVRRMLAIVGHPVKRLRRTHIGPLALRGLQPGQWRDLTPKEVSSIKQAIRRQ